MVDDYFIEKKRMCIPYRTDINKQYKKGEYFLSLAQNF